MKYWNEVLTLISIKVIDQLPNIHQELYAKSVPDLGNEGTMP